MRLFVILFITLFSGNLIAVEELPVPVTWNTELKELVFDDDKFYDGEGILEMETPYRALDAAMVPITIKFFNNQSKDLYVKSLTLIVDENPSPVVSRFVFSPKVGNASVTTRIRIDKYTYVRAIAEMSDTKKYMLANFVKAAGGCSAPSLADMDAVMARIGKMKMKFIETGSEGSLNKAELLISHPNYSGLQFNQLTRAEIPAHFVDYIKIEQDEEMILEARTDISLSENPSIRFHYLDSGGPLKVTVEDNEGQKFAGEYSSSQKMTSK